MFLLGNVETFDLIIFQSYSYSFHVEGFEEQKVLAFQPFWLHINPHTSLRAHHLLDLKVCLSA